MNPKTPLTTDEYRKSVTECISCVVRDHNPPVFSTPRFGLGNRNSPKLMVIGSNPPRDPARCLAGAFTLPYIGEKWDDRRDMVDQLVIQVVSELGLHTSKDVWSTSAVKCPLHFDREPTRFHAMTCAKAHLAREIVDVKPKVILCIGYTARQGFMTGIMGYPRISDKGYTVDGVGSYCRCSIRTYGNVVESDLPDELLPKHRALWVSKCIEAYHRVVKECYE